MTTKHLTEFPDALSLVYEYLTRTIDDELDRYEACSCTSCKAKARHLKRWLEPAKEAKRVPPHPPEPTSRLWQCNACLRDVPAALVACPYCGTERFLTT